MLKSRFFFLVLSAFKNKLASDGRSSEKLSLSQHLFIAKEEKEKYDLKPIFLE